MNHSLNEIRNMIVAEMTNNGKMQDNALPENFLDETVKEVRFRDSKISNTFLEEIATSCPDLESLDLTGCFNIWDMGVGQVLRACPGIRTVDLTNCRKLTDKVLAYGAKYGRKLKRVRVGGAFNLSATGVQAFVQKHPNVHRVLELDLSGLSLLNSTLSVIGEYCPRLERLGLGYTTCTGPALQDLVKALPNLKILHLHWATCVDDAFLLFISTTCNALTEINLTGVKEITIQGVTSLIEQKAYEASRQPDKWKKLEVLMLQFANISKQNIEMLEQSYPYLEIIVK